MDHGCWLLVAGSSSGTWKVAATLLLHHACSRLHSMQPSPKEPKEPKQPRFETFSRICLINLLAPVSDLLANLVKVSSSQADGMEWDGTLLTMQRCRGRCVVLKLLIARVLVTGSTYICTRHRRWRTYCYSHLRRGEYGFWYSIHTCILINHKHLWWVIMIAT